MKTALGKLSHRSQAAAWLGDEWGHLVLSKASVSHCQMITPVLSPFPDPGEARLL